MTPWTITAIDASQPAGYLAALGLLTLAPAAQLRFEHTTPVLLVDGDPHQLAGAVAEGLEAVTSPESMPLPDVPTLRTTTPAWSAVAELCRRSWAEQPLDCALRLFDLGAAKTGAGADPQVIAGALVLISGKSYPRKSLSELWPDPPGRAGDVPARRAQQRQELRDSIAGLLQGQHVTAVPGAMAMRYTTSDPSPRLRSGAETAAVQPALEALAYVGATRLLPGQLGHPPRPPGDSPRNPRPGLTWALNPVPMTLTAVINVHETRAWPATWLRFTAVKTAIGGGTKAAHFTDIRPLEDPL